LLRRRAGAFGECRDQWRGEVERVGRRHAVDDLAQACAIAVVRGAPRQAGGGDARQLIRLVVKVRLAAVVRQACPEHSEGLPLLSQVYA
jgi:hypothetical protein